MQNKYDSIDRILPFGELLRSFVNQNQISKGDLKRLLRERGVFFPNAEKENLVPYISTIILSPSEFDNLNDCYTTREDNIKKSSSRIDWASEVSLFESIGTFEINNIIKSEHVNYNLTTPPKVKIVDNNKDKVLVEFEIERFDMNKAWHESKNTFSGNIYFEKSSPNEVQIIKSYTSPETEDVGSQLQNSIVKKCKDREYIKKEVELRKILFGDFSNEDRIVFFYRLSSNMDSLYFEFMDIVDMEFRPDPSMSLPQDINWMYKKTMLNMKGNELLETFFIKDKKYHKYLQFWEMESSFLFNYIGIKGRCNVVFSFRDFSKKSNTAEFEINISKFSVDSYPNDENFNKNKLKNKLLNIFEDNKNETYKNFLEYLKSKNPSA